VGVRKKFREETGPPRIRSWAGSVRPPLTKILLDTKALPTLGKGGPKNKRARSSFRKTQIGKARDLGKATPLPIITNTREALKPDGVGKAYSAPVLRGKNNLIGAESWARQSAGERV